jgi:hypothetical protein
LFDTLGSKETLFVSHSCSIAALPPVLQAIYISMSWSEALLYVFGVLLAAMN